MKKLKRITLSLLSIICVLMIGSTVSFAADPNFAESVEDSWPGLFYTGTIQCQPSYIDNGRHATRGFFVYRNGADGEKYTYTEYGYNKNDTRILSATSRYRDKWSPIPNPVKTTLGYNFSWVPHDSNVWPASLTLN